MAWQLHNPPGGQEWGRGSITWDISFRDGIPPGRQGAVGEELPDALSQRSCGQRPLGLGGARQASVLQRRHSVFPVPVGLSRMPFTF